MRIIEFHQVFAKNKNMVEYFSNRQNILILSSSRKSCNGHLGEVELQGVICRQADTQSPRQVLGQRVAVVVEEEGVVAEGRHGDSNLRQIVQVLQHRNLQAQFTLSSRKLHLLV